MASSSTNLDTLSASQSQKEVGANALFDAGSPATIFGRRASTTTGLTWGYYGGRMLVDGVLSTISNGTCALTASATNYVEASAAGAVSKNTTAFTAGQIPLYTVVTGTAAVTSYTDERAWVQPAHIRQRLALSMGTDANVTLSAAQCRTEIIDVTSSVSLSATRDLIVPLTIGLRTVRNSTTGSQSLRVIGATGTGVTIANAKTAQVFGDGTNIVRVTADQ
jgi:hypothetical protein